MKEISVLQRHRSAYRPKLPPVFLHYGPFVGLHSCPPAAAATPPAAIRQLFPNSCDLPCVAFEEEETRTLPPLKVGVVLSGGQAPG